MVAKKTSKQPKRAPRRAANRSASTRTAATAPSELTRGLGRDVADAWLADTYVCSVARVRAGMGCGSATCQYCAPIVAETRLAAARKRGGSWPTRERHKVDDGVIEIVSTPSWLTWHCAACKKTVSVGETYLTRRPM